jgi:hypothetical protein
MHYVLPKAFGAWHWAPSHGSSSSTKHKMKKHILILLIPSLLLAFQPPVLSPGIASITPPEPKPQSGVVAGVAIGAAIVVGVGWLGFRVAHKIMNIWEKQVTNQPPPGVVFTLPPVLDGPILIYKETPEDESGY